MSRYLAIGAGWILFALVVGCGKPGPETAAVEGVVKLNGKPQPKLLVRFLPDPGQGNNSSLYASGTTDDQGHYVLEYSIEGKTDKGAAIGWNVVLLEDRSRGPTPQGQVPPPPLIPTEFSSPATTPLKKEVKAGPQTINLDIKK